ncbi:hypothetical protein VNO77_24053 [Canavalia gladiata]|uniref:Uncharacterized protein n=1 Tax=Canavalia gladiata TaxID=3824 RepID=A0AAN9L819_CANGL
MHGIDGFFNVNLIDGFICCSFLFNIIQFCELLNQICKLKKPKILSPNKYKIQGAGVTGVSLMAEIDLKTAPADFRFPTTNQTRHCFTRYIEFHRCLAAKGENSGECEKFAKYYRSLCPGEWVERWNEQRDSGTFPGPL